MARRPSFSADTPAAALRDYVLNAIAELFHTPRVLPILRRDPPPPPAPLPLLFEDLPDQRKGEPAPVPPAPEPEPAPELDPRDYPNAALMSRIIGDALPPPSALSVTRRRKARERAEAAAASAEDVAYVQAAILDILPKGWPSYAKEVLSIRKDRGVWICRLRLFDGEIGTLRLSGQPGGHGYAWELGVRDKRPFQFDDKAWAWVRLDEDA